MSLARSLSKKTPVAREEKRRNICNFLLTDFSVQLLEQRKSVKEVIYENKKGITDHLLAFLVVEHSQTLMVIYKPDIFWELSTPLAV